MGKQQSVKNQMRNNYREKKKKHMKSLNIDP